MVAISTVDGATVNLLHLAGNSGPLVLFLHANGFHITCYTPLAEDFAKHNYQCWGVEFRGQGSLPAPPGNLVDLYLSDLFAVGVWRSRTLAARKLQSELKQCGLVPLQPSTHLSQCYFL